MTSRVFIGAFAMCLLGCSDSKKNSGTEPVEDVHTRYERLKGSWKMNLRTGSAIFMMKGDRPTAQFLNFGGEDDYWSKSPPEATANGHKSVDGLKGFHSVKVRTLYLGGASTDEMAGYQLEGDTLTIRSSWRTNQDKSWRIEKLTDEELILIGEGGGKVEFEKLGISSSKYAPRYPLRGRWATAQMGQQIVTIEVPQDGGGRFWRDVSERNPSVLKRMSEFDSVMLGLYREGVPEPINTNGGYKIENDNLIFRFHSLTSAENPPDRTFKIKSRDDTHLVLIDEQGVEVVFTPSAPIGKYDKKK